MTGSLGETALDYALSHGGKNLQSLAGDGPVSKKESKLESWW